MREYNAYLNQAWNMKNFDLNGKVDLLTPYEQALENKKMVEELEDEENF